MREAPARRGRAALVRGRGTRFDVEDVEVRAPLGDEVLVEVDAVGMCHADLAARDGDFPVPLPAVLGHEGTGLVLDVGAQVQTVRRGDRVVLTFDACGSCAQCGAGAPTRCAHYMDRNFGADGADPPRHALRGQHSGAWTGFFGQSSFASLAIATARNAVPVRQDVDPVLLAPLGCAVQTGTGAVLTVARPTLGSTVVVVGLGPVGMSAVMAAARCSPAARVIAVDLDPRRLQVASDLGATDVLDASGTDPYDELRRDGGADVLVECSGSPRVLPEALGVLRPGGTCVLVGAPPFGTTTPLDVAAVVNRSLTIRGTVEGDARPRTTLPWLADRVADGTLAVHRLVRTYPLADVEVAARDMLAGDAVKPVLLP